MFVDYEYNLIAPLIIVGSFDLCHSSVQWYDCLGNDYNETEYSWWYDCLGIDYNETEYSWK